MKNTIEKILLLDENHGIYIPQQFVNQWSDRLTVPLTDEQKEDLSNPSNEFYWETWEYVLMRGVLKFPDSRQLYRLEHDMDLWAEPVQE